MLSALAVSAIGCRVRLQGSAVFLAALMQELASHPGSAHLVSERCS